MADDAVSAGCFLDIEGAFDNANFWIGSMLEKCISKCTLEEYFMAEKVCQHELVLSPIFWSTVADNLLVKLSQREFEGAGYVDDIIVLIKGKCEVTISACLQTALNTALGMGHYISPKTTIWMYLMHLQFGGKTPAEEPQKILNKLQRLACIGTTGAMSTAPTQGAVGTGSSGIEGTERADGLVREGSAQTYTNLKTCCCMAIVIIKN